MLAAWTRPMRITALPYRMVGAGAGVCVPEFEAVYRSEFGVTIPIPPGHPSLKPMVFCTYWSVESMLSISACLRQLEFPEPLLFEGPGQIEWSGNGDGASYIGIDFAGHRSPEHP